MGDNPFPLYAEEYSSRMGFERAPAKPTPPLRDRIKDFNLSPQQLDGFLKKAAEDDWSKAVTGRGRCAGCVDDDPFRHVRRHSSGVFLCKTHFIARR